MRFLRRRRPPIEDAVVCNENGSVFTETSPSVASSLRYLGTRLANESEDCELTDRIAFTSALRGEGVSYTSRRYAATTAHDTRRPVCWIDLNWWTDRHDDEGRELGVSDVILNDKSIDDIVIPTDSPFLWTIGRGSDTGIDPATLVRGYDLDAFLDALSSRFTTLVLDLPAVLGTSDAVVLAEHASQVIVVVRPYVTTTAQVARTLELLQNTSVVGTVINAQTTKIPRIVRRLLGLSAARA